MKRKLKPQFLSTKSKNNKIDISKSIDSIEKKIFKGLITFLWVFLLIFWGIIPNIVLYILNIDKTTLSDTQTILITFINDILFLTLIIGVYFKTMKKDMLKYFNPKFIIQNFKTSLVYWSIGLGVMFFSNYIIAIILNGQLAENEEVVRSMVEMYPLYMAFNVVIYAPITEELIFRKSIRDIFSGGWTFTLASGLIFGGLHVITSLDSIINLLYLIPYCSLGIAFALLYYKTDNIFSSIVVHALHNTLALVLYLIML